MLELSDTENDFKVLLNNRKCYASHLSKIFRHLRRGVVENHMRGSEELKSLFCCNRPPIRVIEDEDGAK